jgi:CTP synthase
MTKYIFFTGGVVSGVGKGVTAAALGRLLKARGFSVTAQKLDPYINVDPGTMSPYQHGEVFVTDDGAETDLDLGHYERFIDISLNQASNVTTGRVYAEVTARERRGDYLGSTIQVIPHITNEIKRYIFAVADKSEAEIVLVEVGGTVGDNESVHFLEALRQMRSDVGRENTLYVHVTFLPHLKASNELKTKPTQHSVAELRSRGVQPDVIIARADHPIPEEHLGKISLFCDVPREAVIPAETSDVLYNIPLQLEETRLAEFVMQRLNLTPKTAPDLSEWAALTEEIRRPKPTIRIALVGKYVELHDAYMSVREALYHAGIAANRQVEIEWIHSGELEKGKGWDRLQGVSGVVVPGGFGERGIEGKIKTARWARGEQGSLLGPMSGYAGDVHRTGPHYLGQRRRQQHRVRPQLPAPGHQPYARSARTDRHGRHDASGGLSGAAAARLQGARGVWQRYHLRAPPPPLGVQQRLPRGVGRGGAGAEWVVAQWPPGRDRRAARPPVHARQPVSPRVQEPPQSAAPALRRLHGRGCGQTGRGTTDYSDFRD